MRIGWRKGLHVHRDSVHGHALPILNGAGPCVRTRCQHLLALPTIPKNFLIFFGKQAAAINGLACQFPQTTKKHTFAFMCLLIYDFFLCYYAHVWGWSSSANRGHVPWAQRKQFCHVISSVAEFCDEYLTFASSLGWEGTPQMSNDKSCLPYFAIFQACHILWYFAIYGKILQILAKKWRMLQNVETCGKMWQAWNMANYGKMWRSNVLPHFGISSSRAIGNEGPA